jgi:GTPase involved in cell partitioning and DNA repair
MICSWAAERCSVLLHLTDGTSGDPVDIKPSMVSWKNTAFVDKPRVTVLNKVDTLDAEERKFMPMNQGRNRRRCDVDGGCHGEWHGRSVARVESHTAGRTRLLQECR